MLSYDQKIIISMIAGGIWIYTRKKQHYLMLPRSSLLSVILVVSWIYLNYKEPLALPFGLCILYLYAELNKNKELNL